MLSGVHAGADRRAIAVLFLSLLVVAAVRLDAAAPAQCTGLPPPPPQQQQRGGIQSSRRMAGSYDGFRADRVPEASLYVSEPNPAGFGNPGNVRMPKMSGWSNSNWLKSRFHFSFAEHR